MRTDIVDVVGVDEGPFRLEQRMRTRSIAVRIPGVGDLALAHIGTVLATGGQQGGVIGRVHETVGVVKVQQRVAQQVRV